MAKARLTAGRIRDFTTDGSGKQAFLWDTDAPGFAVRATSNVKAYIFESRLNGSKLRITIGDVRVWDIDKARAEARRLQTLVDSGTDPRDDKAHKAAEVAAKRHEAKRKDATVAEAWSTYVAARRGHWGERYYIDHVNFARPGGEPKKRGNGKTTPGPLAPLMGLKLADVTPEHIRDWLQAEAGVRATQARQAFGAFRTFLAWCEDQPAYRGLAAPDACNTRIARQELPKKAAKDDVLQREQLPAWFAAMRQIGNPVISAYLQSLLLTGARREELATLTWEHLDFQWRSLTIRDKVDGERTIPLTPYVASLLAALPRRNQWVFSSPTAASGRLQEPRIAHNRALDAAALPALTLHGLRRSFGTLSEWVEMPTGVVAQIMGHKPSATAEKHYRRRPLDLLRQWHTKLEGWILAEAGLAQPVAEAAAEPLRRVK
jgi:integrase